MMRFFSGRPSVIRNKISILSKNLIKGKKKNKPLIGLALGGGAAWGISHVGVLKALEENHISISCICGTSIGSLIGGLYAAGISTERLFDLVTHAKWKKLSHLSLPLNGFLSNEPMEELIENIIGDRTFHSLNIPFAAVATDLVSGEEVILDKGKFSTAIRASCAIPGIFQPVHYNGRTLVDGGVVNNVPVSVAKKMGADMVIGVNVSPLLNHWMPKNSLQIILKSYLIMQNKVARREASEADVLIAVDTNGYSPIDLTSSRDLYHRGYLAGLTNIDKIKHCIDEKR